VGVGTGFGLSGVVSVQKGCEVRFGLHVVGNEEVRKHRRGRVRVGQCIVGAIEGHVVALAEIAEAMGKLPPGVKAPGHAQGAQSPFEDGHLCRTLAGSLRSLDQKLAIKSSVVSHEQGALKLAVERLEHGGNRRSTTQHASGDAVNVGRSHPRERPLQAHESFPLIEDDARRVDGDDTDLEHSMPSCIEPRGFEVDDRKAGQ
jgi:hypothetical protein